MNSILEPISFEVSKGMYLVQCTIGNTSLMCYMNYHQYTQQRGKFEKAAPLGDALIIHSPGSAGEQPGT